MVDVIKVGQFIQTLRKKKGLTQNQIAQRLMISSQAVSKWERGETLPDTAILVDLAFVLETTVDHILNGGEKILDFSKRIEVTDIKKAINHLSTLGDYIGKDNTIYKGMIDGINDRMKIDVEEWLSNNYKKEGLVAELIIQHIQNGTYLDLSDIKANLEYDHWLEVVISYANKYGIK